MKRIVLVVLAAIVVVALAVFLWPDAPAPLAMAGVSRGDVERVASNTRAGTVSACRRSGLSMPMGGRVEKLHVKEGDHVRKGTVLLEVWNDDREAQLAQSRTTAEALVQREHQACLQAGQAERDAERAQELEKQQLVSRDLLEQATTKHGVADAACAAARADLGAARAQVRVQEALLEETRLRAPFAGVVAEINGEIGEYVTPSPPGVATPPAVDLIDDTCLYVTAPIDEVDAAQVRTGLPVRITLDAFRGRQLEGKVSRIAPYVLDKEKQARTVDVEVQIAQVPKDVLLLVGYSADVDIVLDVKKDVLRLPAEALIDGAAVLRRDAKTGVLEKVAVQVGASNWSWVEVLDGLAEGDQVVTALDSPSAVAGAKVDPEKVGPEAAAGKIAP